MPRYDYLCRSCRERFTIERGIMEEEGKIMCPKCRKDDIARDYSGVAIGGRPNGACSSGSCSGCGSSCGGH